MAAFPTHRPHEPARREALLSRVAATTEATRAVEAQLESPGAGDLLVPAARALLGVLHRAGGGELVVSLGTDPDRAVRVRDGVDGPAVELVPAAGPTPRPPAAAPADAEDGVAARLAAQLRAGGVAR